MDAPILSADLNAMEAACKEFEKLSENCCKMEANLQECRFEELLLQEKIQTLGNGAMNQYNFAEQNHSHEALSAFQQRGTQLNELLSIQRKILLDKMTVFQLNIDSLQESIVKSLGNWRKQQKYGHITISANGGKERELNDIQEKTGTLINCLMKLRTIAHRIGRVQGVDEVHFKQLFANFSISLRAIIEKSLIITRQPTAFVKEHKTQGEEIELCLLLGPKNAFRHIIENAKVNVDFVLWKDSNRMQATEEIKKSVGKLKINKEDVNTKTFSEENGRYVAKFKNLKLEKLENRRALASSGVSATEQMFKLQFSVDPFDFAGLDQVKIVADSLPLSVSVHYSQDCNAFLAVLWQRAFADEESLSSHLPEVEWHELAHLLQIIFKNFTNTEKRELSERDLRNIANKLEIHNGEEKVTFHRFAKAPCASLSNKSVWSWLYWIMRLVKEELSAFWENGCLFGFISRAETEEILLACPEPMMLIRFSDSQQGAVSIAYVKSENGNQREIVQLEPMSKKDLEHLSLAHRINSCFDLQSIQRIFPNIVKGKALEKLTEEDLQRKNKKAAPVKHEDLGTQLVMVVDNGGSTSAASFTPPAPRLEKPCKIPHLEEPQFDQPSLLRRPPPIQRIISEQPMTSSTPWNVNVPSHLTWQQSTTPMHQQPTYLSFESGDTTVEHSNFSYSDSSHLPQATSQTWPTIAHTPHQDSIYQQWMSIDSEANHASHNFTYSQTPPMQNHQTYNQITTNSILTPIGQNFDQTNGYHNETIFNNNFQHIPHPPNQNSYESSATSGLTNSVR